MNELVPQPPDHHPNPVVVPLTDRHPTIWWVMLRFQLAIDAYREMLEKAVPNMAELDERRLSANALAALKTIPEENRQMLETLLVRLEEKGIGEDEMTEKEQAALTTEVRTIFRGDRYAAFTFLLGWREEMAGPRRTTIVLNSLLVMAISAFEVLLAGLISRRFVAFPDALHAGQQEFSLEDVRGFQSEEDAVDLLLSRRVSKIMYGSLDDWSKWFGDHCNASFADLAIDWDALREAFQRRHVIMHAGGRVSSEYIAKVRPSDPPALGSQLNVNTHYLQSAFDQLDALGTAVSVLAWGTWFPTERDNAAQRLLRRTYQTMLSDRWEVTEKLATLSDRLKCSEEVSHSIRCNGWLSRAERESYEAIRSEVEAWDASALSGRFRLVRLVLLGDLENGLQLVPALVASKEITPGEFREWPILRTLREHPGWTAVAEAQGI